MTPTGHASTCPVMGEACASCTFWDCRTSEALASRLLARVDMTDEPTDQPVAHLGSFDETPEDG